MSDCGRYEWERVIRRCEMNPSVKLVALTIATYAARDGGSIYPGVTRLAAVTGLTDKTVRAGLKRLREIGLLTRTREGSRKGRQGLADEYALTIPVDLLTRIPMLTPDESPELSSGDEGESHQDHRNSVPRTPVLSSGSPELSSSITGSQFPPTEHTTPGNNPTTNVRRELRTDVTTARGDDDESNVIQFGRNAR